MTPNAAPEWQADSLRWRSREIMEACPLEGLVRLPGATKEEPTDDHEDLEVTRWISINYGNAIIGLWR